MPQLADFSLECLKGLNWDMLYQSEELALGFLILILPPSHPDSDLPRDIPDPIAPDKLVQLGVYSDVVTLHHLTCEFPDFTHCSFGFLLECDLMHAVLQADSTVDTLLTHYFLLSLFHH